MKNFLTLSLTLFVASSVWAQSSLFNGIYYNTNINGKAFVTQSPEGYSGSIKIPSVVKRSNGMSYSVISIEEKAFYRCGELTSITIPESVTSIGNSAFEGCRSLTSIIIPESVTSIGNHAFWGCTGLTSITIPESVTSIENQAFQRCTGLTSITIPESVTSIGIAAFSGCTGLTSITIPESVTSLGTYAFSGCTGLTSVTIPKNVTSLGDDVFLNCTNLTSITVDIETSVIEKIIDISNSMNLQLILVGSGNIKNSLLRDKKNISSIIISEGITSIGDHTFRDCTGLTSITIPESVTSIGDHTFRGCTGLTSITIPESVTSIGTSAFEGTSLTSVTIPESVTSIDVGVFYGCKALSSIQVANDNLNFSSINNCNAIIEKKTNQLIAGCMNTIIPECVTSIGNYAFGGCTGLTSITIPESVTSIGISAFSGCTGLTSIIIPESITSIENQAFYGCKGLTSITISEGVTSIGNLAFSGCKGLTSITIPESVISIGSEVFSCCSNMTSITCLATIPPNVTGDYPFDLINLYVPCESKQLYKKSFFHNNIRCISCNVSLSVNNDLWGTVEGDGDYDDGSTATLVAIPASSCIFKQWNDGNTENPRTITVESDLHFEADFNPIYTVSLSVNDNSFGTVKGEGEYENGSTATLTATPTSGYKFMQWNDDNTENPRKITVTSDMAYTAIFKKSVFYDVALLTNDFSYGSVEGGGKYEEGTVVSIVAKPNSGYRFKQWDDGNTNNPRSLTANANSLHMAMFEKISTAISDIANETTITIANNQILVNGEAPAFVVTISGKKIANQNLKVGVYFVEVEGETVKLSIK